MRQYASWQAPFFSLWSKSFYVDVAKNWHGLAYLYLFFLICFTWLFMSIKKQLDAVYFADQFVTPIVQQMPTIVISKGVLSIDRPSPYAIKAGPDQPVIVFDTREKPIDPSECAGTYLITKNTVFYCPKNGSKEEMASIRDNKANQIDLSTIDRALVDQQTANQFIKDIKKSVALIVFIIMVPLGFIFCVLQTLIYGLLGKLIANLNKVELSYGTLIRLSTVALTPVLLVDSLLKVRDINTGFWLILSPIITICYLVFAIRANTNISDSPAQSTNV